MSTKKPSIFPPHPTDEEKDKDFDVRVDIMVKNKDGEVGKVSINFQWSELKDIPYFKSAATFYASTHDGKQQTHFRVGWTTKSDKQEAPVFKQESVQVLFKHITCQGLITLDTLTIDLCRLISYLQYEALQGYFVDLAKEKINELSEQFVIDIFSSEKMIDEFAYNLANAYVDWYIQSTLAPKKKIAWRKSTRSDHTKCVCFLCSQFSFPREKVQVEVATKCSKTRLKNFCQKKSAIADIILKGMDNDAKEQLAIDLEISSHKRNAFKKATCAQDLIKYFEKTSMEGKETIRSAMPQHLTDKIKRLQNEHDRIQACPAQYRDESYSVHFIYGRSSYIDRDTSMKLESLRAQIDNIYIGWERQYKRDLNKKKTEASASSSVAMAKALAAK